MAKHRKDKPGDVPRSPSGRVPQWVMDEALGRTVDPVPFRAATGPSFLAVPTPTKRRRARAWFKALAVIGVVVAVAAALNYAGVGRPSQPSPVVVAQTAPNGPPPGFEESPIRLTSAVPAVTGTGSTHHRFSDEQNDGSSPVTWSPCRPIHYVVRTAHAPPHGAAMLDQSFTRLSQATGLVFINDGDTTEPPVNHRSTYQPERYGSRWAPVLIAWATADEVPDFGVDVAGEASVASVDTPGSGRAYVSGAVYLDPAKVTQMSTSMGEDVGRSVILHELAHLVGLAHVNDVRQIMWPRGNSARLTEYQTGDLAGLAILGQGACQPGV
ncbi:MAG: peptidase [Actinobacteria bacterium]|nr:peptidase [Actinomycetota bacterium]